METSGRGGGDGGLKSELSCIPMISNNLNLGQSDDLDGLKTPMNTDLYHHAIIDLMAVVRYAIPVGGFLPS